MRLAWVHSMRFLQRDGVYFGEALITHDIWRRYLRHFDQLLVIGRKAELSTTLHTKYVKESSGPNVEFLLLDSINSPLEILRKAKSVRHELREALRDVDGVIARLPSEHGLAAIEVAIELGKPFAIELVGCAFDALWNHGDTKAKIYAPIMAMRVRRAVRKARFVLYVTREFLQRRYPATFEITNISNVELPTSVAAISDVDLSSTAAQFQIEQQGPKSIFTLGLAGALQNEYKGHATAFRAVQRLRSQGYAVRLRLLGMGAPARWSELAQRLGITESVQFDGVLPPGEQVFKWMNELDLYIQPSLTEGLPRALVEAMANGKPALASSAGGIPELLDPVCLHQPGDWKGLAAQIEQAMNARDWLKLQGSRNKRVAAQYLAPVLDAKRFEFWSHFADHCREQLLREAA